MDDKESYRGVWIFLEHRRGALREVSLQLCGIGRELADKREAKFTGMLLGDGVEDLAREALTYGLDRVLLVEHPLLKEYAPRPYAKVVSHLIRKHKPEIVLYGATKNGRGLGGRVHAVIETGLAADCVGLEIDEDGYLDMIRPSFGGKSHAHILCKNHRPQMASARVNVFKKPEPDPSRTGEILREAVPLSESDIDARMVGFKEFAAEETKRLEDAEVVVAGGYGVRDPKHFAMIEELAELLGGVVAGSRKVVDLGWLPKDLQVGQTGKTVRPKLYLAIGVSGAVQHLAGMQESDRIAVINNDPKAPMFKIADFGVVGDLFEVVPEMIRLLRGERAARVAADGSTSAPRSSPGTTSGASVARDS